MDLSTGRPLVQAALKADIQILTHCASRSTWQDDQAAGHINLSHLCDQVHACKQVNDVFPPTPSMFVLPCFSNKRIIQFETQIHEIISQSKLQIGN